MNLFEQNKNKVNHLICLGKGDLATREVIHLYIDQFGRIGDVQYYTGIAEIVETYDNSNTEDLRNDGIKRFTEIRNTDKAEIDLSEMERFVRIFKGEENRISFKKKENVEETK